MSREILAPLMIRMKNNRCYRLHNVHDDFRDQLSSKEDSRTFAENRMIYIEPGKYIIVGIYPLTTASLFLTTDRMLR